MVPNRIVRTNDRVIGGVCSALASRFNKSAKLIRVIFIVASLAFFYITIIIYAVIWISSPYEIKADEKAAFFSKQNLFKTKMFPRWFVILSYSSLYPILFWPFIFFGLVFMFDNPPNFLLTFIVFILIMSYPIVQLAIIVTGFKIYQRQKVIATLLPLIPIFCGIIFIYYLWDYIYGFYAYIIH